MSKLFEDMNESTELRVEKILQSLITKDQNIKLKTVITSPVETSSLRTLAKILNDNGLEDSGSLIAEWLDVYEQYMVSYKGMSWDKITEAVSAVFAANLQEKETTSQKLMGKH